MTVNAILEVEELLDTGGSLSTKSPIDFLLEDYSKEFEKITNIAQFFSDEGNLNSIGYFTRYAQVKEHGRSFDAPLTNADGAIKALDAKYWQKALGVTDVMKWMPSNRREEWNGNIQELNVPEFTEEAVVPTIQEQMSKRAGYLAEMVDGIFTGLSKEHLTNRPEGFCKRMIIANVRSEYYHCQYDKAGYIHDLRYVIGKFTGNELDTYDADTKTLLNQLFRRTGVWHSVDGGTLKIRVYLNGNAHLEIHPEMAYRLNQILASIHPMAIPEPHRRRPNKKKGKDIDLIVNLIPETIVRNIHRYTSFSSGDGLYLKVKRLHMDKYVEEGVHSVLSSIGGVQQTNGDYVFDYDAIEVLRGLLISRVMPDTRSHQYYPTPPTIASDIITMANIEEGDKVLEPSAGQGALVEGIPAEQVTCVEISPLHAKILEAKGYDVYCTDFLKYKQTGYHKILMNPPFSQGRLRHHIEHAASLLHLKGKVFAVVPASYQNKEIVKGMKHTYSDIYEGEFKGTSIDTVIVCIEHRKN